jgi:hypothetical protein
VSFCLAATEVVLMTATATDAKNKRTKILDLSQFTRRNSQF